MLTAFFPLHILSFASKFAIAVILFPHAVFFSVNKVSGSYIFCITEFPCAFLFSFNIISFRYYVSFSIVFLHVSVFLPHSVCFISTQCAIWIVPFPRTIWLSFLIRAYLFCGI